VTTIGLKSVFVSYGNLEVLQDVNLTIAAGDRVAVMGPSGSGKTTLLKVIAKLNTAHSGQVHVEGKVGYMPQKSHDAVVPWRRVCQLIPNAAVREELGLEKHKKVLPKHLSGGQLRRLALGHVFHYDKHIFLLDEPLTGLDIDLRNRMIKYILGELDPDDILVFVTHYIEEAEALANKAIHLADGCCKEYSAISELKSVFSCTIK
jgi:ABC-type multidrug transport system ATPase subunit